ncbi:MAG: hypothetical protein MZV64_27340 [Ignavibacteriales bacterium]|nr:hypothetical protein [Ignavibacteriales bacterium]
MIKKSLGFNSGRDINNTYNNRHSGYADYSCFAKGYEKQYIVSSLQHVYATGNAALKKMAADKGVLMICFVQGCLNIQVGQAANHTKDVGDEFVKYFNVAKNCSNTNNMDCWAASYNTSFDGTGSNLTSINIDLNRYKFITTNGISYAIYKGLGYCNNNVSNNTTGHMRQSCGELWVDLNGPKKGPNYMGRDIFLILYNKWQGSFVISLGRAG